MEGTRGHALSLDHNSLLGCHPRAICASLPTCLLSLHGQTPTACEPLQPLRGRGTRCSEKQRFPAYGDTGCPSASLCGRTEVSEDRVKLGDVVEAHIEEMVSGGETEASKSGCGECQELALFEIHQRKHGGSCIPRVLAS